MPNLGLLDDFSQVKASLKGLNNITAGATTEANQNEPPNPGRVESFLFTLLESADPGP